MAEQISHAMVIGLTVLLMLLLIGGTILVVREVARVEPPAVPKAEPARPSSVVGVVTMNVIVPEGAAAQQ